jgi:hypothetical protein
MNAPDDIRPLATLLAPRDGEKPTEQEKADAFRALDLSLIPPQLRAWYAFEAGIKLAQEAKQ